MWSSVRGFHMLFHNMVTDRGELYKKSRAGYAFSTTGISQWKVSDQEAMPVLLEYSDGSVEALGKRQRYSLVYNGLPGRSAPTHVVSGVSGLGSTQGEEWGDGWTAVQPLNIPANAPASQSNTSPCPSSSNALCKATGYVQGVCVCVKCAAGYHLEWKKPSWTNVLTTTWEASCIADPTPPITSCPANHNTPPHCFPDNFDPAANNKHGSCWKFLGGVGKSLTPGTFNDQVFRCGYMNTKGERKGNHGYCVPLAVVGNGVDNCESWGTSSDENPLRVDFQAAAEAAARGITAELAAANQAYLDASRAANCPWPLHADGPECRPCRDHDVPGCVSGRVVRDDVEDKCICEKCEDGSSPMPASSTDSGRTGMFGPMCGYKGTRCFSWCTLNAATCPSDTAACNWNKGHGKCNGCSCCVSR